MGFGKRGGPRRPDAPMRTEDPEGDLDLDSARTTRTNDGFSSTVLTAVLAVVAIAVGAGSALLFTSPFSFSLAPQHGFGATSKPPPATGAHARIADICMPALKPGGIRKIDVTDEELRYTRALHGPGYFNCALAMEPERFCASDEREILVKELQTYFGSIAAKQRVIDRYSKDPSAKTVMKMADAVEGKDDGISAGRRPMPDSGVIELMQGLVRQGYLRSTDFGWSVPEEISIHIKDVQREKQPC